MKRNPGQFKLFNRAEWDFKHASRMALTRQLFVFDPVALQSIVVTDQYVYEETPEFLALLNPVFSIAHMWHMLPLFYNITRKLQEAISVRVKGGQREIDMLDWMGPSSPSLFPLHLVRPLLPLALKFGTPALQRKLLALIPSKRLQRGKQIADEIEKHARHILEQKKRAMREGDDAVTHQIGEGKDIMSKLMLANMGANDEDKLPEDELLGQDVQDKPRAEILEAIREHGPEIPYDVRVELPYLDAVCRETLRLHAPVPRLMRKTRKDIVMPLAQPTGGVDGALVSEIPGPDAAEWKPERCLSPAPEVVKDAHIPGVYSHLMTFLGGGRACIGFKFSQLEMKIVLAMLLSKFTFAPSDKEIRWNIGGILYPTVGMDMRPAMLLQ
ncbi:hypothetical protein FOMPIDRAFT_1024655, partial [Fomitopsis schrenkii]